MWRWFGALWVLPVAVPIWLLYVLPCWALGWHVFRVRRGWVVEFHVTSLAPDWYLRLWRRWYGLALPFCIILHQVPQLELVRVRKHETRHTDQWLLLVSLLMVLGYRDHPLEKDARDAERSD